MGLYDPLLGIFSANVKLNRQLGEGDLCYWFNGYSCVKTRQKTRPSWLATAPCSAFLWV